MERLDRNSYLFVKTMRNLFKKIPLRVSLPLLALIAVVVILGLTVFSRNRIKEDGGPSAPTVSREPSVVPSIVSVESVTPGVTQEIELSRVEDRFASREIGNTTYILVGENQSQRYSTIEVQNGVVSAVTIDDPRQFQFPNLRGYQSIYGQPDPILYGPWEESGFRSYLYLKEGLIVIGHERTGEVIEVWRIPSGLSFEQLLQKFGDRFSISSRRESHF